MTRAAKLWFVTFLTFVRFPLVLLFFTGAILYTRAPYRHPWVFFATFVALITSAVTDLFDGYFARRFNVVTKLGAHADPLMDKFFLLASLPLATFVAAANKHTAHATLLLVLTLLFLARDQWVTFLRSIGSIYNVSGTAHWSGKLRTAVNFPLICLIYYYEEAPPAYQLVPISLLYALETFGLIVNVLSIVTYTHRYWPYVRQSATVGRPENHG
jgi:phosphatidylglycerophosphate synthase